MITAICYIITSPGKCDMNSGMSAWFIRSHPVSAYKMVSGQTHSGPESSLSLSKALIDVM